MSCKYFKTRKKNNKKEKRIYNYCTIKRKEITYDDCKECKFKEYAQKKAKQCIKIKNNNAKIHFNVKRSSKLTNLERNRTSLFTEDLEHCMFCGSTYKLTWHEIYPGKNRQNSMKYKLCLRMCLNCHEENQESKKFNDYWHKKGQLAFIANYPDLDFLSIFHRNYLLHKKRPSQIND